MCFIFLCPWVFHLDKCHEDFDIFLKLFCVSHGFVFLRKVLFSRDLGRAMARVSGGCSYVHVMQWAQTWCLVMPASAVLELGQGLERWFAWSCWCRTVWIKLWVIQTIRIILFWVFTWPVFLERKNDAWHLWKSSISILFHEGKV